MVEPLGYPSLLLPDQTTLNPILRALQQANTTGLDSAVRASNPWRLSDCSLAIVDLCSEDADPDPLEPFLDDIADLPTLYLDTPLPSTPEALAAWQHQIARKIACISAEARYGGVIARPPTWLLLGSTGGPEAVREFIDALPLHCPVSFLYGQHINPGYESNLIAMLDGRRGFSARLAKTGLRLCGGQILVTPANQRVHLIQEDTLLVESNPWPGQFQPSLDALVVEYSQRRQPLDGIIVFSGMGCDGTAAIRLYAGRGGRVWVQSPSSCVVSSMPEATLASSNVEFSEQPRAMAEKLASLVIND